MIRFFCAFPFVEERSNEMENKTKAKQTDPFPIRSFERKSNSGDGRNLKLSRLKKYGNN